MMNSQSEDFSAIGLAAKAAAKRLSDRAKAVRGVRQPAAAGEQASELSWDRVPGGESVRRIIQSAMSERRYPVYIHGPAGVGKSSLLRLIFERARAAERVWAIWRRADEALYDLATSRDLERQGQKHLLHNCGHLFFDDIGTRAPSPQMYSDLFDLLEARAKRPLWITSNVSPEELEQAGYDDRIYTRLLMGTVIEMQGANQRALQGKRFLAKDRKT